MILNSYSKLAEGIDPLISAEGNTPIIKNIQVWVVHFESRTVSECPGDFSSFATLGRISKDAVWVANLVSRNSHFHHLSPSSDWNHPRLNQMSKRKMREEHLKDFRGPRTINEHNISHSFQQPDWQMCSACQRQARTEFWGDASGRPFVSR